MTTFETTHTTTGGSRPTGPRFAVGTRRPMDADEIAATGLRDRWYPILPSRMVEPGAMIKVTRLGVDWLLFRDARGAVHMLEDRCPHRSAPLSVGQHLGDRVACLYHGLQVDGTGTVVSVPGMPGCALEGKRATASLSVKLRNPPATTSPSGVATVLWESRARAIGSSSVVQRSERGSKTSTSSTAPSASRPPMT